MPLSCLLAALDSAVFRCHQPCISLTALVHVASYITLLSSAVHFSGISIVEATK